MLRLALALVVAASVVVASAQSARAAASCSYSYSDSTLYVYDVKQHNVVVHIVDTETETVLHEIGVSFHGGNAVTIAEYAGDIDATTEFVVYTSNGTKLLTECYA